MYNRTVLKNGSCCTVRPGKVSCLQKFRHFWMIIRDLFFESGSTEATKIKKILQRYVIYISDQITVSYLNTETGNRRLNIVGGMAQLFILSYSAAVSFRDIRGHLGTIPSIVTFYIRACRRRRHSRVTVGIQGE